MALKTNKRFELETKCNRNFCEEFKKRKGKPQATLILIS